MKKIFLLPAILLIGMHSCKKAENPGTPPPLAIPLLTSTAIGTITSFTAQAGGTISSDAGYPVTARGICWSTIPNPTTADSKTSDGTGTGNYSSILTGLVPATTYYVRAYAINSKGTAYGNEFSFLTLQVSTTTVTDIDGNVYPIITIGSQTWMKENLKTTRYRNGEAIPTGLNDASWGTTLSGAYAIYNNDAANNTVYGKLYNWYAAVDSRKLAPAGWHIPSTTEWMVLINFLGGLNTAGGKMKETGLTHWNTPNTGATNNSGFTALSSGYRNSNGSYSLLGNTGYCWTTSESAPGSTNAEAIALFYNLSEAVLVNGSKLYGVPIRCVKD